MLIIWSSLQVTPSKADSVSKLYFRGVVRFDPLRTLIYC
jgi:hypothetical protein